jgi:hypothetical protein
VPRAYSRGWAPAVLASSAGEDGGAGWSRASRRTWICSTMSRTAYWKEVSDDFRLQLAPIVSLCPVYLATGHAQPESGGVRRR